MEKVSFLLLMFLLVGCANSKPDDSNDEEEVVVSDEYQERVSVEPRNVKVYLENSASMAGYNKVNANGFTSVISELVSVYGRSNSIGYFYSKKLSEAYTANRFADDIAAKRVKFGDSSPLHIMVDSILKRNESLSFLVTDGIMSGTNEQIRHNPEYNKDMREHLQKQISDVLLNSPYASGIACSIYKFESNYNGIYYCYNNRKVTLTNVARPFFVIALGHRNYVRNFADKVEKGLDYFKPSDNGQIHFGVYDFPLSNVKMVGMEKYISNDLKSGECSVGRNRLRNEEDSVITFGLDISQLPNRNFRTEGYIKRNSKVLLNGNECGAKIESRTVNDSLVKITLLVPKKKIASSKQSTLQYSLSRELPGWVNFLSCVDDANIANNPLQVFNLSYFINAFKVIETNSEDIVNSKLTIKVN